MPAYYSYLLHSGRLALIRAALVFVLLISGSTSSFGASQGWATYPYGPYYDSPTAACKAYDTVIATTYVGVVPAYGADGSWNGLLYECVRRTVLGGIVHNYWAIPYICPGILVAVPPGRCVSIAVPIVPTVPSCSAEKPGFMMGDPVSISSGGKFEQSTDLIWGSSPLHALVRTYRGTDLMTRRSALGPTWSLGFERSFSTGFIVTSSPAWVRIGAADGSISVFTYDNGHYTSPSGGTITPLNAAFTEWAHNTPSGETDRYKFLRSQYRLISTSEPGGMTIFYEYDGNGQISKITDTFGRSLQISYTAQGYVKEVASPSATVHYEFDDPETTRGVERLRGARVVSTSGTTLSETTYDYVENDQWIDRFLLKSISHHRDTPYSTTTYDDTGRVLMAELAGGAYRYEFAYPSGGSRVVTDPLGTVRTYELRRTNGQDMVASVSQPGGSGCAGAVKRITHDSKGLVTSSINFNQKKTCFSYDAGRRLQTTRIEGLSAAAACPASTAPLAEAQRKVTTKWHPRWDVPVGIAEPLRRTTYVYNGQPDPEGKIAQCASDGKLPDGSAIAVVCREITEPTSDKNGGQGFAAVANGKARVTSYSYNQYGQVLSKTVFNDGGRPDQTSTREYFSETTDSHTKGDLWKETDPNGQVTEYLEYNPAGRWTKMRDPRGQVTLQHYDGLQRVTERVAFAGTPAEEITSYAYNPAGLLEKVVFPDTTYLLYTYDEAERLTDITDKAGNRVHYTLDGMGNRTKEEVLDAGGALSREVTRVFDALNRLQDTSEVSK